MPGTGQNLCLWGIYRTLGNRQTHVFNVCDNCDKETSEEYVLCAALDGEIRHQKGTTKKVILTQVLKDQEGQSRQWTR